MTDCSGDKPLSELGPNSLTFESDEIACETSQALLPESRLLEGPANQHLGAVDWAAILLCLLISVAVAYLSLFAGASVNAGSNQSVDDIASRFPPVAQTVLVSIDGFRHDYIDRTNEHGAFIAPTLRKILSQGVSAVPGMQPVMPSVTFPNHNSLVTGLFPESSRIVANTMYNPRTKQWWHTSDDDPSWWGGEPIWVTLQRTKRRGKASPILDNQADAKTGGSVNTSSSNYTTASVFWPGSTVEGRRPNIWSAYNSSVSYEDRVARVLSLLFGTAPDWRGQRADFVAVYFEGVDHAGHEYGTTSPELAAEIARVDASIAELWQQVPGINLIVVSDHGMTDVSSDRVVDLDDAVPKGSAISIVSSPVLMLINKTIPVQTLFGRIAHALSKSGRGTAFLKDALPDRWHLKHSELIPPVLAVANIGWMIRVDNAHLEGLSAIHAETHMDLFASKNDNPSARHRSRTPVRLPANHPHKGAHGYDNVEPDMQALFIAAGPAFRKHRKVRGMRAVDLYPLLCHMFGAEPAPNNGSVHISEAAMLPVSLI